MEFNVKKFEREIKNELKILHIDRPEVAARQSQFIFGNDNEIDYEISQPPVPLDQIKFYPGSINGPAPEDDPDSYSRWFVEH